MTRAEAIKIIERAKAEAEWEKSLEYQIAFEMAIGALNREPGEWWDMSGQAAICSGCGRAQNKKQTKEWKYCPMCGAEMRNRNA